MVSFGKASFMERNIILSICIPTYNKADFLQENLNSLLLYISKYNLCNIVEIIISDNGSGDRTQEIGLEFQHTHPGVVQYSRNEENLGYDKNIFKCIELAHGEYIHFLGDDDFFINDGLLSLVSILKGREKYSCVILSNDFLAYPGKMVIPRPQTNFDYNGECDKVSTESCSFFNDIGYRIWVCSNIVVRRKFCVNFEKSIFLIHDWAHIFVVAHVMRIFPKAYLFSSLNPLLRVSIFTQNWLNSKDAPLIYLNNLLAMKHVCSNGNDVNLSNVFLKYKSFFLTLISSKDGIYRYNDFIKNVVLIIKYFRFYYNKSRFYTKFIPMALFSEKIKKS